jgi:hypothetical protein
MWMSESNRRNNTTRALTTSPATLAFFVVSPVGAGAALEVPVEGGVDVMRLSPCCS